MPEINPGTIKLSFTILDQEQVITFEMSQFKLIENPLAYTENLIESFIEKLVEIESTIDDPTALSSFSNAIDSLNTSKDGLSNLNEAELKRLARYLDTNLARYLETNLSKNVSIYSASFSSSLEGECLSYTVEELEVRLLASISGTIGSAALTAGSLSFLGSGPFGAVITGIGAGSFFVFAQNWVKYYQLLYECSTALVIKPNDFDFTNKQSSFSTAISAEHGSSMSGTISAEFTVPDNIQSSINELRSAVSNFISLLPDSWVELLNREYSFLGIDNSDNLEITVNSDYVSISDHSLSDETITITLEYKPGSFISEEPFEIRFNKENYSEPLSQQIVLSPPVPVLYPTKPLTVFENQPVVDTLHADYATSFEVVQQPGKGTLSIENPSTGVFSYQFTNESADQDQFTVKVSNSIGNSENQTVYVSRNDVIIYPEWLFGEWELRYSQEYTSLGAASADNGSTAECYEGIEVVIDGETKYFRYHEDQTYLIRLDSDGSAFIRPPYNTCPIDRYSVEGGWYVKSNYLTVFMYLNGNTQIARFELETTNFTNYRWYTPGTDGGLGYLGDFFR